MTGQKEHIVEAATRLFVERGYEGISMREIAQAAGLSKAGLYHHFHDKEALFLAVLTANLRRVAALIDRARATHADTRARLTAILRGIFSLPPEYRAIIRLASQEMAALSPEARATFAHRYRELFIERMEAIVREGVERGELRPLNPRLLTWMLLGMAYPFFYPAHQGELGDPAETIATMLTVFFEGAAPAGER